MSFEKEPCHTKHDIKQKIALAVFVVQDITPPKYPLKVVAIGIGSNIIGGDKISLKGNAVHNSNAKIIDCRSLICWIHHQIKTSRDKESCYSSTKTRFNDLDSYEL
mmetsp:Transcript_34929/g.42147  ORF Transcript_34929/g.42147 Transcript_34929/m.42147 type:complete len:106 (+) Transcript_34929:385-702(+)